MQIAGVEDEPAPAPAPKKASSISGSQWAAQLEKSYASSGGGGGSARRHVLPTTAPNSRQQSLVFCDPPLEHAAVCLANKYAEAVLQGPP